MNAAVRVQKRAFGVIAVDSANGSDVSHVPKSAFQSAICSECHECDSLNKTWYWFSTLQQLEK